MELPKPKPAPGQVLVRVHACGICRTDLHVVEGELAPRKSPIVPGHQGVGVVEENGSHASRFQPGARVGIPWLHQTCGACEYCRSARENLCEHAVFTGWMVDGGYAEYVVAPEDFVYALPKGFSDRHVGFRTLRLSGVQPGGRLAIYGFATAAHGRPKQSTRPRSLLPTAICRKTREWDIEVVGHQRPTTGVSPAWPKAKIRSVPEPSQAPFPL